jgi:hypothetical protein
VIGALVVAGVGPASAQVPALVLGILLGAFLVAGSGVGLRAQRGLDERRAEFGPSSPAGPEGTQDAPDEAEAWRRERERYEGRE